MPQNNTIAAAGLAADDTTSAGHARRAAGIHTHTRSLRLDAPPTTLQARTRGSCLGKHTSPRLDSPPTTRTRQGSQGGLPENNTVGRCGWTRRQRHDTHGPRRSSQGIAIAAAGLAADCSNSAGLARLLPRYTTRSLRLDAPPTTRLSRTR